MARLAHPNVIAVHDVGMFDGQVFLAMEFLGGGTLKSWLGAGPRPWREVLDVFVAAGRGLAAAHAAGLVHRDFKPENVLLDRDGRPRVVDFGLAREATAGVEDEAGAATFAAAAKSSGNHLETLTRTGAIMGTPAYMAPEQIVGEATDERTDQFSFCVALYEALYGQRPFQGVSLLQLLHNVTEGDIEPVPENREVPAWIRRAVLRGLKADPAQRWPSMAPLIAALEDDPAARHRRRLVGQRRRWRWSLAGAVAVTQVARHRHQAVEREIGRHLHDAAVAAQSGRAKAAELARPAPPVVRGVRRGRSRARGGAVAASAGAGSGSRGRVPARRAGVRDGAGSRQGSRRRAPRAVRSSAPSTCCWRASSGATSKRGRWPPSSSVMMTVGAGRAELRRPATLMLRIAPGRGFDRARALPGRSRRAAGGVALPVSGAAIAERGGDAAAGLVSPRRPRPRLRRHRPRLRAGEWPAPRGRAAPSARGGGSGWLRLRTARRILVRGRGREPANEVSRHRADPPPPHGRVPHRPARDDLP